jgi:hypothetical protein
VAFGARARRAFEDPSAWLAEALTTIGVRRVKHLGNHRYAFSLGAPAERRRVTRMIPLDRQLYPKTIDLAA